MHYFASNVNHSIDTVKAKIYADDYYIGYGVEIDDSVKIGSPDKHVTSLYIGDNVFIGHDSSLYSPNISIGDYTKIHNHAMLYGRKEAMIGHNCWFGQNCILDAEGGFRLGNGVGAGAYSQLWSHIRHGDVMEGCQYLNFGHLDVEDDVWFVGHCIVSPIRANRKSMALVGSTITKDMEENHIYGGSPAKDLTEKLGPPFVPTTYQEKYDWFWAKLRIFQTIYPRPEGEPHIIPVEAIDYNSSNIQFDLNKRIYTKTRSPREVAFMKFLLPEAKFIPEPGVNAWLA